VLSGKDSAVRLTPTITSHYFTKGKVYNASPVHQKRLAIISDDNGDPRYISLPIGGKCPHLQAPVDRDEVTDPFEYDRLAWDGAGRWKEVIE
jgi:hypothetical protein